MWLLLWTLAQPLLGEGRPKKQQNTIQLVLSVVSAHSTYLFKPKLQRMVNIHRMNLLSENSIKKTMKKPYYTTDTTLLVII